MQTLHLAYEIHVKYELLRSRLLDNFKFADWIKTYSSQKKFFPDENSAKFWDDQFQKEKINHPMANDRNIIVSKILKTSNSILNIGVGRGDLENILFANNSKSKYLGTDITPENIKYLSEIYPNKNFKLCKLNEILLINDSFDFVLLLEIYEHLKPLVGFSLLKSVRKLLKNDGKLIISVPINENLPSLLPENPNGHMRILTEHLLINELYLCGFNTVSIFRLSSFNRFYYLKKIINKIYPFKDSNNIIIIARKR